MNAKFALSLFQIAVQLMAAIQRTGWYNQGKAEAYAHMDDEQKKRIALAEAARADADAFATGDVRDPDRRD